MKKIMIILLFFAGIAKGQTVIDTPVIKQSFIQMPTIIPMDGQAYIPVIINGVPSWISPSYYEFKADSVNQTKTNLIIGVIDTAKGVVYDLNGYITLLSQTGSNALQIKYSYTDEAGRPAYFLSDIVNANKTASNFQGRRISIKPKSKITFSMLFSGNGTVVYNVGCDARVITLKKIL